MKKNIIKVLAVIPGLLMLLNAIGFMTNPEQTANDLHMTLLDGLGRSTQIGDMTSFFMGTAILIFVGVIHFKGRWLYAGALFLGGAALFRSMAAVMHGADWAIQYIIIEIVLTIWLCATAYAMDKHAEK
ncbi:MAG: hypothetical protein JKY88_00965 [Pseudomonadales bacterium]|nr:hypothetical protein [Pseudomonadales bacterium]